MPKKNNEELKKELELKKKDLEKRKAELEKEEKEVSSKESSEENPEDQKKNQEEISQLITDLRDEGYFRYELLVKLARLEAAIVALISKDDKTKEEK